MPAISTDFLYKSLYSVNCFTFFVDPQFASGYGNTDTQQVTPWNAACIVLPKITAKTWKPTEILKVYSWVIDALSAFQILTVEARE